MASKPLRQVLFEGLTIIAGSDDLGMALKDIIALREALADASEIAWARAEEAYDPSEEMSVLHLAIRRALRGPQVVIGGNPNVDLFLVSFANALSGRSD